MGWEWILHSDPGPSLLPFLGEEMLLMDQEKNETHHFFEVLFEAECGTILPMKLTNMQRQGLHKDINKNKYLLFDIILLFNMLLFLLFHDSFNDSGSATLNCFSRSFP